VSLVIDADAAVPPESAPARGGLLESRLFSLVRIAVTLAIVAGLVLKLSLGDLRSTVADSDPWLLLAAAGVMFLVQALVALKWLVLVRARGVRLPFSRLVRAYCGMASDRSANAVTMRNTFSNRVVRAKIVEDGTEIKPAFFVAGGQSANAVRAVAERFHHDARCGELRLEDNHPGLRTVISLPRAGPGQAAV